MSSLSLSRFPVPVLAVIVDFVCPTEDDPRRPNHPLPSVIRPSAWIFLLVPPISACVFDCLVVSVCFQRGRPFRRVVRVFAVRARRAMGLRNGPP